ncbi:LOW QUALITY PROTEIN: leucine-rich repeat-containing protein 72 [Gastrophryne carolinensis]
MTYFRRNVLHVHTPPCPSNLRANMADKAIEGQLEKRGYRSDSDVLELYLGRKALREVTDLSRFRQLRYLWLNHNKISRVNFLAMNYRLSELYLDHNELCSITGSLKHLTSLHTLMLNDNQLTHLQATIQELSAMTNLRVLNLFHNPLEQEPAYRPHVLHRLPSLELLDRKQVTQKEREEAFKLYNPERTAVMQSLGFGRRTDSISGGRAATAPCSAPGRSSQRPGDGSLMTNPDSRDCVPMDDKVLLRAYQRSIMQYTLVDWCGMPHSRQRRSRDRPCAPPHLMTLEFR